MRKPTSKLPPIERLRALFHYNPLTGRLTCLVARGNRASGALAGSVQRGRRWVMVDGQFCCAMQLGWALYHGHDPAADGLYVVPIDGNPLNLPLANLQLSPYPHIAPLPPVSPVPRGRRAQRPPWQSHVRFSRRDGCWKAYHKRRLLGRYDTKALALNAKREVMNG